jgi:hypothetical protein
LAWDFLGTFNRSQFDRFVAFARTQLTDVGGRIAHLVYERNRLGALSFEYEPGGKPVKYTVSGAKTTYIGGLVAAYEVLGGNVLRDLQVRSQSQAVHVLAGSDTAPPSFMSNGDAIAGKGLGDAVSAEHMRQARTWMSAPIHYRREYLERKIRRALDYAEQLDTELSLLMAVTAESTQEGSLEFVVNAINQLISDYNYRIIYDDKGRDPDGRLTSAPLLPYSRTDADPAVAGNAPGVAGRDDDGFRYSGQQ